MNPTPQPPSALRYDAAIVDLDGTMVDTLGDFEQALGAMLVELGAQPLPRAQVMLLVGKGSEHLVHSALPLAGLAGHDPADALARYFRHYALVNGLHSAVFPGVPEGLQALRDAGLRLACLTNKPLAFARALLEANGLAHHFEHIFGGDSFAAKKPDPLPVRETCRALGSVPERTLAIGDSRNDALAASGAGCAVALVGYGYNHGEPIEQVPADFHLDSLEDLAALLARAN
ncbi:phosphoglycolate phosphatase [Xylophilus rhododendri]|uniref:Phosphoglycolate phosphatase n=1 Tax=Xylophilus rhododendri TaxID=2697032 RepID=A0A857J3X4_9BURK|nr:phosphoglycolate phosphatase [Xylophilus rhododendri]QHI98640.1 phosphoglycolate phosphatase [Xylophilus rhododendri]